MLTKAANCCCYCQVPCIIYYVTNKETLKCQVKLDLSSVFQCFKAALKNHDVI